MGDKTPFVAASPVVDFQRRTLDGLSLILACVALGVGVELWLAADRPLTYIVSGGMILAALATGGRVIGRVALHALEVWTQADINRDGAIGEERVILVNRPVGDDKARWRSFVEQAGRSTTILDMQRAGFSRLDVEAGREALMERGLAIWNGSDHRAGWSLAVGAESVLAALPYCALGDPETL